ncbi:SRPBCC family protein [Cellulomonas sp. PhB143]|uniref:SRPBCC family protein n=1 Tax=Cellulomonas sp. PhB143 TaxID=2485186 RepID=UPI0018F3B6CB|nr:SRPBCC family protein [Cellulomonas sp. PhB143]
MYTYVVDPAHLPEWAAGLAAGVVQEGGRWFADSPMGRVEIAFAPGNDLGVLDHDVTMPDGRVTSNPLRAVAAPGGSEVIFTVRRAGASDEDFARDVAAVRADLETLRRVLDARRP